jgi:hypothetical protein
VTDAPCLTHSEPHTQILHAQQAPSSRYYLGDHSLAIPRIGYDVGRVQTQRYRLRSLWAMSSDAPCLTHSDPHTQIFHAQQASSSQHYLGDHSLAIPRIGYDVGRVQMQRYRL